MPYLKIIRPANCLFAVFTTLIGAWYFCDITTNWGIVFAGISVFFIAAGGYTLNDFYDCDIDRINRPQRVLPSGAMLLQTAKIYGLVLFTLGLLFAFLTLKPLCIIIALVNCLLLFFYAKTFKKKLLVGNIVVAWNACSTFIYGALLTENINNILPLVVISFLYTILREWVKTIEDHDGDMQNGARTLAVVLGKQRSLLMLYIPAFLLIASIAILCYAQTILALLLHCIVSVPLCWFLFTLHRKHNYSRIQSYMKIDMLCVLVVFIIYDVMIYRTF